MAVEQWLERLVAHIEPPGISAEGRHHQAVAVGGETAAADHGAPSRDARHRVKVAGDLPRRWRRRWLMPERHPADRQRGADRAADACGQMRIVIAANPEPFAPPL